MSGTKLALLVVVPFLALTAVGYWLTQVEPPRPEASRPSQPPPHSPTAPSARSERGKQQAVASARVTDAAPLPDPPAGAVPAGESRTPVMDGVARSLLDARRASSPAAPESAPEARGAVEKEDVRVAVRAVMPLVRECFEDVAARYPGPQKVTLRFTIEGQGLTGYFKDGEVAESTIQDPFLQSCFLEAMTDAKFPAPHGGGKVTIVYPFSFVPASDAGQ